MGKRGRKTGDLASLEGVVTFSGSYHALRAESVLRKNGYRAALIPAPREISRNCGVALRIDFGEKGEIEALFARSGVRYEEIHHLPDG